MMSTTERRLVLQTFGLCVSIFVLFVQCDEIHDKMAVDDHRPEFHTQHHNEHDKPKLRHGLHKRAIVNDRRVGANPYAKDVVRYLNPENAILFGEDTPVWVINGTDHYRRFAKGILKRALDDYASGKESNSMVQGESINLMPSPNHPSLTRMMKTNRVRRKAAQLPSGEKDTVYPTILVTTDFDLPHNFEMDPEDHYYEQLVYQMAFWNAVDLRFRTMTNPKVRLRIAGIMIGADRAATPWIHNHTIDGKVQVFSVLNHMAWHWHIAAQEPEFAREGFHIVATATNLQLVDAGHPKLNYTGVGAYHTLCAKDSNLLKPVMMFTDDGAFGNVGTAAHELGHILGLNHDNGTDETCSASAGYAMSPARSTSKNNLKWSNCSLHELSAALRDENCADAPREFYSTGKRLGKILPGKIKTMKEQCKARGYEWACMPEPSICTNLLCMNSNSGSIGANIWNCSKSWAAAEGTTCAPNRVCLNGKCRSPYPTRKQSRA